MKSPKQKPVLHASLAEWRSARGLTLREAGAILGYSESGYFKLERGMWYPRREDLQHIQRVTGVALEALVGVA